MDKILRAAIFARVAHKGQRRDNGDPYIYHPARVAARVACVPGVSEDVVAAAWLHDVLEDTSVKPERIDDEFGEVVLQYVNELTNASKDMSISIPRAEKKARDREKLAKASPQAKLIKACDRLDNLQDLHLRGREYALKYLEETDLLLGVLQIEDDDLAYEINRAMKKVVAIMEITPEEAHQFLAEG